MSSIRDQLIKEWQNDYEYLDKTIHVSLLLFRWFFNVN